MFSNTVKKTLVGLFVGGGIGVIGCGDFGPDHVYFNRCDSPYYFRAQTKYDITPNLLSKDNIAIDARGLNNINTDRIDRITNELETCLINTFGNPPILSPQTMKDGGCPNSTFDLPLHRECMVVKVAADCFHSEYDYGGYQQLLPYVAGLCKTQKDLPGDPNELCYWRVGKQDRWTSVTCPSDFVLKEPLLEFSTGCQSPWYDNSLATCMAPSSLTGSLDDGSGP